MAGFAFSMIVGLLIGLGVAGMAAPYVGFEPKTLQWMLAISWAFTGIFAGAIKLITLR
jgi:hypothetical protein